MVSSGVRITPKREQYDEAAIRHLDDLESIQKSPNFYLGDTSTPWFAIKEVIDNAVDEALAKSVTTILIKYDRKTGEFLVCDDGRGIPVGPHPKLKIPTL